MTIAAAVFLVAVLLFFYFTEDSMSLPMTHQIVKYGMVVLCLFKGTFKRFLINSDFYRTPIIKKQFV
jgi:hypothetical protein